MTADPPTQKQLERLAVFAMFAWDDIVPILYGFRLLKDGGIHIYVKQKGRGKNVLKQEGESTHLVLASMETFLCQVAANKLGCTEELLRGLAAKALS